MSPLRLPPEDFLTLSSQILSQGHSLRCNALGTSMFPLIRSGSRILVEPAAGEEVQAGDVLVYQVSGSLVAHRLIRKLSIQGKLRLIMRGDAFPRGAIEQVTPEQVLGRVVAVDWGNGLRLRLDQGLGKFLGLGLAKISPILRLLYPALTEIKARLRQKGASRRS